MTSYCGRFAPTPSGNLHFGSLVTALGSFLRARSMHGSWHLRIDDIDTTRCSTANSTKIITTLKNYGFIWDGPILYQSQRTKVYTDILKTMTEHELVYGCDCTRSMLKQTNGLYDKTCRSLNIPPIPPHAVRLKSPNVIYSFTDILRGPISPPQSSWCDDFTIRRRDGIFSYNLVTVIDDNETNVTEVVRGVDILDNTPRQITLYKMLNLTVPNYLHLPLALETNGLKLSKQNHSTPINETYNPHTMLLALRFLGQEANDELLNLSPSEFLKHATANFKINLIPTTNRQIP